MADTQQSVFEAANGSFGRLATIGFEQVLSAPSEAEPVLLAVLSDPTATDVDRVIAAWGLGRLRHNDGRSVEAVQHLVAASTLAAAIGFIADAAEIRLSAAVAYQSLGDLRQALAELDGAERSIRPAAMGRLVGQRALVLLHIGRIEDASKTFDAAVAAVDPADTAGLARTLLNRGVARIQLANFSEARLDFARAHQLATACGERLVAAQAMHNLGCVDGRLGDIPAALQRFRHVRDELTALGQSRRLLTGVDIDECEVTLDAGLGPESVELATRVVADLEAGDDRLQLAEAKLMRARALLLTDELDQAAMEAEAARQLFVEHGRTAWASLALEVSISAEPYEPSGTGVVATDRLMATADELSAAGWAVQAARMRLTAARRAIDSGDVGRARLQLAAATARSDIAQIVGAESALVASMLARSDGDLDAARTHAQRGLRALERQRSMLGSTELRAVSSSTARPLIAIGLDLALADRRADEVFEWSEQARISMLTASTRSVAADRHLAPLLARWRALRTAESPDSTTADRLRQTEQEIARTQREVSGQAVNGLELVPCASLMAMQPVGQRFVEYVDHGSRTYAVVIDGDSVTQTDVGPTDRLEFLVDHLHFALRRLSSLPHGHRLVPGAASGLRRAAADLAAAALGPLHPHTGGRLVVAPDGPLHRVPWAALAMYAGLDSIASTPSASLWASDPVEQPTTRGAPLLVLGPNLPAGRDEVRRLAEVLPDARQLLTPRASHDVVLEALVNTPLAHIAAHGTFRMDSPMFSTLQLDDGPITIHDLEGLEHSPAIVVLTACDAGRARVYGTGHLLGTTAALLAIGVRHVIAPMIPIADHAVGTFSVDLHTALANGVDPARALAHACRLAHDSDDPSRLAAAWSFQCLGTRIQ